ncbi:MAG TPA: NACHT domain-containing protein, partial [Candidatus Competibacteraceae bacterium]|nr:NACHT domain-containing protein [Candidatus Competibacteraceae bacterium]
MDGLQKISGCDSPNRAADIIFVHGLDGDACTTWHPKDRPDAFWPAWLGEDIPAVGVWSLGYAVSASAWKGHTMPLADRATNILDWLELDGIGCRPVMFICHSLGGLLVKQVLRHAGDFGNPAWKAVATQTKAVVFLSTPHSGADLASWVQYIGGLLRATVSVEELEAHHPRLRELNLWYRNHVADLGIKTVVYCEKRPVAGILVVNETTADPGIAEVIPIPVDEDHVSICKPVSKDSQIYRRVKRLVEDIVNLSRPSGVVAGGSPFRRYYWDCIERWSEPRHALDKRFVHLTLLIDQGEEAQGLRWAPQARTFQDLRQVLAAVPDPALVLLGPPGSGKSTLLQHVEVDYARDALNRDDPKPSNIRLTFFVSLNLYKAAAGEKLLSPKTWLEQRWAARTDRYSELPTLDSLLQEGCLVLLLDALNEMPHQHTEHIDAWQDFLARLVEERPGNRVIFSCRTLDYGAKLSTKALPVPQVQIEQLSNEQVREFIEKYTAQRPEALWRELSRDTRQLDLYRSPYYLKLLVDQAGPEGKIPRGRAMLFSGFVRQALNREVAGKHPLFKPGVLLTAHECERMAGNAYTGCELPTENPLLTTLSALAYRMQETEQNPEASQVRMERSLTLAVLGTIESHI